MNRFLLVTATAVAAASAVAVLGSASAAVRSPSQTATVAIRATSLGRILVDGRGRTLYLFEKDRRGRSACSGTCASYWPPVLAQGKPRAGRGARAALLGTIRRADGTTQVTYSGHPLYRYALDAKPGQTRGQESHTFGAGWYVLSRAGNKVEAETASPATPGSGYPLG